MHTFAHLPRHLLRLALRLLAGPATAADRRSPTTVADHLHPLHRMQIR
ncbi:hypothetical protein GCM10011512_02160 [Tersicoccus solisilvae]|uniref:Uncharacterized protein n=1 Tax=Tersicoccus solisilvae TaxID=1882339 RepID=A0ABQ1NJT6_9MICC|nr:hypothetical protein [Tersicoccus solisilvae]GGC79087.1 hypothetical protein GCM10011512_02160 [Tersicoccus solisilvae]